MTLSPRNAAIQLAQPSAIPHISINEVRELANAAGASARNVIAKERDPLLIMTLFDGVLRVSEGFQITPSMQLYQSGILIDFEQKPLVRSARGLIK